MLSSFWMSVKILKLNPSASSLQAVGSVATFGTFDGIHLGHQTLIKMVTQEARERQLPSVLLTFYPHPAVVLGRPRPARITSLRQTAALLSEKGIDYLVLKRFTKELSQWEPEQFADQVFFEMLNVKHLVIGPFASLGKDRRGTPVWIEQYFRGKGRTADIVQGLALEGDRVSSGQLRSWISEGNLAAATKRLGRPFSVLARVISGSRRGQEIGVPTANQDLRDYVHPPSGVYLSNAILKGDIFPAISNLGLAPTFNRKQQFLETHILNYSGKPFYGEWLEVALIEKIREEKKFSGTTELKTQLQSDIERAHEMHASIKTSF